MKKSTIKVPADVRYISDWRKNYGYRLPDYPCIINKRITGCGFTEECIRNDENVILCSPRKILLENKEAQHVGDLLYVKNELETSLTVDKDLNAPPKLQKKIHIDEDVAKLSHIKMLDDVRNYVTMCKISNRPCKLLVTYDSFRIVKEALQGLNCIDKFRVVVDEFQSIFTDSRFKSGTEMEFLCHLQDLNKVCFVSATPMIESYLDQMDEFKDLPYIDYDWKTENPSRLIQPELKVRSMCGDSLQMAAYKVINKYLNNEFEKAIRINDEGNIEEVESRELVIYVNSVKNICDIIRKAQLSPEQVNILCANNPDNQLKITRSLRVLKKGKYIIGKVPIKGESRKMFTLCTRTVYLGADFYSDNARTVILSDANIECLAVDITLDLPQILGRQRDESNPWKNRAELYVKLLTVNSVRLETEFVEFQKKKNKVTSNLLSIFYERIDERSWDLANKYLKDTTASNYKDDYVAVNTHIKGSLVPAYNKLVMLSEQRAFEIQQVDYKDRFHIFAAIKKEECELDSAISDFIHAFYELKGFPERMRLICNCGLDDLDLNTIFKQIPAEYSKYYYTLGPDKIKGCAYIRAYIDKAYNKVMFDSTKLDEVIYSEFSLGEKLSTQEIIDRLEPIYSSFGNPNRPKAKDLDKFFEIKMARITLPDKTRIAGYKIIKKLR